MATAEKHERMFGDLEAEQECTEIESLCMSCHENGITRILLTKIPHFREVILMAFECPHCGCKNNEIQSGSAIMDKGVKYTCKMSTKEDLNRQIVKNETATVRFDELDFEIPANTQRGLLNTVEGFLSKAIEDLAVAQDQRLEMDPSVHAKVQSVMDTMQGYIDLKEPFTVIVDDPAGNSYIENLCAPKHDPKLAVVHYVRTDEQCVAIGLDPEAERRQNEQDLANLKDEVFSFPANCSSCNSPCDTKMKIVDIPHFKEVVIMSTACDTCGYKSNEVKAGGAVSEFGTKISLKVCDTEDLSRDILKSESCGLCIPELDLELEPGTLGGRFTTIEGLLQNIYDELSEKVPFSRGDSSENEKRTRLQEFLGKVKQTMTVSIPYTLILDDPLGNSYLQNPFAPDADPCMTVEQYERTFDQNEYLGLNDMNVDHYNDDIDEEDEVEN